MLLAGIGATTEGASLGASTPVSAPMVIGGAVLTVHGADTFSAGLRQFITGQGTYTQTSNAITYLTGSRAIAEGVDLGLNVSGGLYAGYQFGVRAAGSTATATFATSETGPIVGGGASLENLSVATRARIQVWVDTHGTNVTVVGSRARGTADAFSDYDYLIGGTSRLRASAKWQLPKGAVGPGIDVFNENDFPLVPGKPHIIFLPRPGQGE